MTLKRFCEVRELDKMTVYQGIRKAEEGNRLPPHIARDGREYVIDVALLDDNVNRIKNAWLFCTNYTYWWLTDWMKLDGRAIARMMAERSKRYKSVDSWNMFISKHLFNMPEPSMFSNKRTMIEEFTVYGTAIALAYYRDNYMV